MNWIKFPLIMLQIFLITSAMAEDDPLNLDDAASMEDIRNTMGDDIFKSNPDFLGNSTPMITEKNLSGTSIGQQLSQPKTRLLSPASTWSLNLIDNLERAVELQMSQSNDVVFGKGTIIVGNGVQTATATGTITGNKLNLDILTDDLTLFRLSLTMNGKSLSGDYHGYSTSYVPLKGIAMGKIN